MTGVGTPVGSIAVAPTTIGDNVSITVRFTAVSVPTFATTIRYCTGCPGRIGEAAGCTSAFVCVTARIGPSTVNSVGGVRLDANELADGKHPFHAATYPVLLTYVSPHTTPTDPLMVNVKTPPGGIASPAAVHANNVPDPATCVITGVANPVGSIAVAPVTTGLNVSATVRFVIVAVPVFFTTIVYVTACPVPGFAGTWYFVVVKATAAGCT